MFKNFDGRNFWILIGLILFGVGLGLKFDIGTALAADGSAITLICLFEGKLR
jgi:hypothetical protein